MNKSSKEQEKFCSPFLFRGFEFSLCWKKKWKKSSVFQMTREKIREYYMLAHDCVRITLSGRVHLYLYSDPVRWRVFSCALSLQFRAILYTNSFDYLGVFMAKICFEFIFIWIVFNSRFYLILYECCITCSRFCGINCFIFGNHTYVHLDYLYPWPWSVQC